VTGPATNAREHKSVAGIIHILIGAFVLTLQDAVIKFLVVDHSLFQTLFLRSITMIAVMLLYWLPRKGPGHFLTSRPRMSFARVVLHFLTFVMFFSAIALIPLGDVIALALTASLFLALLSGPIAGEPAGKTELIAVAIGFTGVVLIAGPTGTGLDPWAVFLALGAALCYCGMSLTTRILGDTEPAERMIVYSACGISVMCACILPWVWKPASLSTIAMMMGLGFVSVAGHWCLVQAYRLAPVHIVAPFEYSALVWGIILGAVFWDEIPSPGMLLGAALIVAGGLIIVNAQRKSASGKSAPGKSASGKSPPEKLS